MALTKQYENLVDKCQYMLDNSTYLAKKDIELLEAIIDTIYQRISEI